MKTRTTKRRDAQIRAAREFGQAHDPDPEHAFQVCKNSLTLFDALKDLHGLGKEERFLLEAAALMHDTGYENRPMQHHKGSRDLILASNLEGFSSRELAMVACIARYHRKGPPQPSHKPYGDLEKADRETVRRLAAILRVADGLDRCHMQSFGSLKARQSHDRVSLHVRQRVHNPTDIETAIRKGDLFEEVFEVKLEIVLEEPE